MQCYYNEVVVKLHSTPIQNRELGSTCRKHPKKLKFRNAVHDEDSYRHVLESVINGSNYSEWDNMFEKFNKE